MKETKAIGRKIGKADEYNNVVANVFILILNHAYVNGSNIIQILQYAFHVLKVLIVPNGMD